MTYKNGTGDIRETARRFFVHSPADISQSYVHWAERLKDDPGITYGCILDQYVIPLRPGDVMAVVARPGHGKSSFMAYMTRKVAQDLIDRGDTSEVAVYVSWEQTVEEIEAFFQSGPDYTSSDLAWGRADLDTVRRKAIKRANLPIWMMGESKRHEGFKRPQMTVEYVYAAVESMYEDYGVKPALMCLDYVQIMPVNAGGEKRDQVDRAINDAKQLAIRLGLPIIIGVQARRDVDSYANPIPTMGDAQWSSSIEQVADKQIALWRPIRKWDPSEKPEIEIAGTRYANDEELFIIRLLKQRFERGYGTWAVRFKPQTLEIHDYERRAIRL